MPENDGRARQEINHRVREAIYAHFVAHALPPDIRELAKAVSLPVDETIDAVHRIEHPADVVLVPGRRDIWMAHPFCAPGTGYQLTCNGQQYWAGCASDAVGLAAVLDADLDITAPCPDCGDTLRVEVRNGASDSQAVIHMLVPPVNSFNNIAFTCGTTLLFLSEEHARRWCAQRHVEFGGLMTLNQAIDLYRLLSGDLLHGHWKPPSEEQRLDAFRAVGLASEFWMTTNTPLGGGPALDDLRDRHGLTHRELEVLGLLAGEKSQKQMAQELGLSRHTVDTHVRNIYVKLGVSSRAAAVTLAMRTRIL